MSNIKGKIQEGAGFVKEELGEQLGDKEMMYEGRHLRNIGKVKQGKAPKLTEPGTGHDEDEEDDNNNRF